MKFICIAGAVLWGTMMPSSALAQVVPDRTLGAESSQVKPDVEIRGGRGTRIEGGAVRGSNLFQSFQEFNVNEGQRVYFANPTGIQNILTRVTGGNSSNILGTLGVEGSANLFLLNPNGILFGQNARLDISGSFVGTTGRAIAFPDGSEFSATQPQSESLLSIHVPSGLQYGANPGSRIVSAGNLSVGQDLTLAADILQVQGQLQAGRDLILRSPHPIQGQNIRLISGRDFSLGDYQGSSLQVNAGGDINYGAVVIDAIDPTLNLTNPVAVLRSGGQITGTGNLSTTVPSGGLQVDLLSQRDMNIRGITTQGGAIHLVSVKGGITTNGVMLDTTNGARDGGAIELRAFDDIAVGDLNSSSSSISNEGRDTEDTGNGGAIALTTYRNIRTGDLNSSSFSSSSSDTGNSGNTGNTGNGGAIALTASGNIRAENLNLSSSSLSFSNTGDSENTGNTGNGGATTITAFGNIYIGSLNSYSTTDSSSLNAGNSGNVGNSKNGGIVTLTASGNIRVRFIGSDSTSSSYSRSGNTGTNGNSGNGGSVTIAASGNIRADTLISNSGSSNYGASGYGTSGNSGNGGTIRLTASGNIYADYLESASFSGLSSGNGGTITLTASGDIHTGVVGSQSSSDSRNPKNSGNGGAITFTASGNIRTGNLSSYSYSYSSRESDSVDSFGKRGNGGAIILTAFGSIFTGRLYSFSFSNSLSKSTGTGGAITLSAINSIQSLSIKSTGYLRGGDITLTTGSPFSLNNSVITSDTFGLGRGGNIQITAPSIVFLNGAQASASTHSRGQAGSIVLKADAITLEDNSPRNLPPGGLFQSNSGIARIPPGTFLGGYVPSGGSSDLNQQPRGTLYPSGIFTQTTKGSTGNAGNIRIETGQLTIRNGAAIAVSTFGRGGGGNIDIRADSILMDRGTLTASTLSGSGGNLTLQNLDLLLMRNNSLISAQARNSADGGNVTINAPNGVIAAVPAENNDIVASANRGNGGKIDMTIASITGLQATSVRTPLSDINASSDLGLDGVVQINPLTTDPSQGVLALPTEVTDASNQISQNCAPQTGASSQFVATGRGGLPLSPDQPLRDRTVLTPEWVTLDATASEAAVQRSNEVKTLPQASESAPADAIVEANGWTVDAQGKVALVTQPQPLSSVHQRGDRVCLGR